MHIYIENDQIKCFHFHFLEGGLRIICNSDIFEFENILRVTFLTWRSEQLFNCSVESASEFQT